MVVQVVIKMRTLDIIEEEYLRGKGKCRLSSLAISIRLLNRDHWAILVWLYHRKWIYTEEKAQIVVGGLRNIIYKIPFRASYFGPRYCEALG